MWSTFAGVILAVVVILAVAASVWWSQVRPWSSVTAKSVLVVLDTERTIRGILVARRGPFLVIADAEVMEQAQSAGAVGTMYVERDRVQWMQVVG